MNTVYHLKTCSTNKRILSALDLKGWKLREIKSEPLTPEELERLKERAGSYEALFSRKSTQIKLRGIELSSLKEGDYKRLLLEHYSFLKRPVFISDSALFVGTDKANLDALNAYFASL